MITQAGGITNKSRGVIRRLRMMIPGMIISQEADERIKIEFAELTFHDFTQCLKACLHSVERTLLTASNYLEKKDGEDIELSAVTEESIGYSLILSRFAAKSITSPLLNVSTVRIYRLSTIAVVSIELMDAMMILVECARRNKLKSIDVIGPIKEIAGIVNRIIQSVNELQKIEVASQV